MRKIRFLIFLFLFISGLIVSYGTDKEALKNKCITEVENYMKNPQNYRDTGNIERVCKEYLNLEKDKNSKRFANLNLYLGNLYLYKGEFGKAENYYLKALNIYEKTLPPNHSDLANTYNILGILYLNKGEFEKAENYHLKAKNIYEKTLPPNHPDLAGTYNNLGVLYMFKRKFNKAEDYYLKALIIYEKILPPSHPILAGTYNNLGELYSDKGEYDKAGKYYLKSLSVVKDIYTFLNLSNLNTQRKSLIYYSFNRSFEYISLCKNKNLNRELFNYWINYKNSIFTYYMLLRIAKNIPELNKAITDLQSLNIQISNLENLLLKETDKNKAKYIKASLEKLKRKRLELQAKIKLELQKHSLYNKFKFTKFEDIKNFISGNTLYIDFAYFEGKGYFAITTDKNGNIKVYLLGKDKDISPKIQDFLNANKELIKATKDERKDIDTYISKFKKASKELYKTLFFNIKEIDKYDNLIISPHGYLVFVPFEALINPETNKYLIEEKTISYIPTAKAFVFLDTQKQKTDKVIVFAKSKFKNGISITDKIKLKQKVNVNIFKEDNNNRNKGELTFTIPEAKSIETILKDKLKIKLYLEEKATYNNFVKVKNAKYLHVATHGIFSPNSENPLNQFYLELDKPVYPRDVLNMNLKGTELVFLSACETGKVKDVKHLTFSGMVEAFYIAGAKDVVITLWQISDKETPELVKEFYKNLKTGMSIKDALRKAKIQFIKQNKNPYYWMPFLLYGL